MLEENKTIELKDEDLEKTSGGKRHNESKRKEANKKKSAPGLTICPQCHEPKLAHRVCPNCGYYDGIDKKGIE